jgi:DNA-binding FadR family transcriptional regulator
MPRKTTEGQIAAYAAKFRKKAAWRKIRKAEKLEAQATQLRKEATALEREE